MLALDSFKMSTAALCVLLLSLIQTSFVVGIEEGDVETIEEVMREIEDTADLQDLSHEDGEEKGQYFTDKRQLPGGKEWQFDDNGQFFEGKRQLPGGSAEDEDENTPYFTVKRQLPGGDEEEEKRQYFNGKRQFFQGKRQFFNGKRQFFNGKRQFFNGKRDGITDKRQFFNGKRESNFDDQGQGQLMSGFTNYLASKRQLPGGDAIQDKRQHFVGKRQLPGGDVSEDKRQYFVGKRQLPGGELVDMDEKRQHFVGKRQLPDGWMDAEDKRQHFVGKRQLPGGLAVDGERLYLTDEGFEDNKRQYFAGKRQLPGGLALEDPAEKRQLPGGPWQFWEGKRLQAALRDQVDPARYQTAYIKRDVPMGLELAGSGANGGKIFYRLRDILDQLSEGNRSL